MDFAVPALLRTCQEPSEGGRAWLDALPGMIGELAERWSLQVGEPFQPGGQTAWVAPARDRAGRDLVVKVGRAHEEAEHEAEGLRAWQGVGVVGIHASARLPGSIALLLDRCRPGAPLGESLPEPEQDVVVTRLLARLHEAPICGPFRPLSAMCDMWVAGFLRRLAAARQDILDPVLVSAAVEVFAGLPRSAGRQVLLCTDLHAGNVLVRRARAVARHRPEALRGGPLLRRPPARPQLPRTPRRGSGRARGAPGRPRRPGRRPRAPLALRPLHDREPRTAGPGEGSQDAGALRLTALAPRYGG